MVDRLEGAGGGEDEDDDDGDDDSTSSEDINDTYDRHDARMAMLEGRSERLMSRDPFEAPPELRGNRTSREGRSISESDRALRFDADRPKSPRESEVLQTAQIADPSIARDFLKDASGLSQGKNLINNTFSEQPTIASFGFNGRFFQFGDKESLDVYKGKVNQRQPSLELAYINLAFFALARGFEVTSTISKPNLHNKGSLHPLSKAVDVRVWHVVDRKDKKGRVKSEAVPIPKEKLEEFMDEALSLGINVRDERVRPPKQEKWSGPHIHLGQKTPGVLSDCIPGGRLDEATSVFKFKPWWEK
jgi:hypothetical protein